MKRLRSLKISLLTAALLIGSLGCGHITSSQSFKTESAFFEWMAYYYKHQSSKLVWPALIFYADSPLFEEVSQRLVIGEFFAQVFRDEPELMEEVIAEVNRFGSDNTKSMAIRVLWLTDTPESIELFEKTASKWTAPEIQLLLPKMRGKHPRDVFKRPPTTPIHIDKLWYRFYASGSSLPVKHVLNSVQYVDPITMPTAQQYAVGVAARESLIYNAARHRRVLEICRKEKKFSQEVTRQQLDKIFRAAQREVLKNPEVEPR